MHALVHARIRFDDFTRFEYLLQCVKILVNMLSGGFSFQEIRNFGDDCSAGRRVFHFHPDHRAAISGGASETDVA